MKIGFCAIWKNKLSEYHAKEEEEIETTLKISQCFIKAKKLGIKIYGLHNIRWASDEQYFTFWECPSFDILEEIISDLEKAGDFKFAKSSHFIGTEFLNLKSNKNYSPDEKFNFGLMLFIKSIKKFEKLAGNFLFDKLDQLFLKNNLMSERCYKSKSFGSSMPNLSNSFAGGGLLANLVLRYSSSPELICVNFAAKVVKSPKDSFWVANLLKGS